MKTEIVRLLKSAALCVLFCACTAAGVAIMLRTPLLSGQRAFLFRLLFMSAICCLAFLVIGVILFLKKEAIWGLSFSTFVLSVGLSTVVMALFFSLGPMTIERPYTIYSLADMTDHAEAVYTAEDIKTQFIEGYIEEAQENQKRINEQVAIGNIEETNGRYRITEKGKRLVGVFRLVEKVFPVPDKNSIYPMGNDKMNMRAPKVRAIGNPTALG